MFQCVTNTLSFYGHSSFHISPAIVKPSTYYYICCKSAVKVKVKHRNSLNFTENSQKYLKETIIVLIYSTIIFSIIYQCTYSTSVSKFHTLKSHRFSHCVTKMGEHIGGKLGKAVMLLPPFFISFLFLFLFF